MNTITLAQAATMLVVHPETLCLKVDPENQAPLDAAPRTM